MQDGWRWVAEGLAEGVAERRECGLWNIVEKGEKNVYVVKDYRNERKSKERYGKEQWREKVCSMLPLRSRSLTALPCLITSPSTRNDR